MQLEEALTFIKENTQKLLNAEHVTVYPVSARSALEAKLLTSSEFEKENEELSTSDSHWKINSFNAFEEFLYSFLDESTSNGMERMRLKLGTPIAIAERLLSSCDTLVRQDCRSARQDLASMNEIVSSVKDYAMKMESESISWRRRALLSVSLRNFISLLVRSTLVVFFVS